MKKPFCEHDLDGEEEREHPSIHPLVRAPCFFFPAYNFADFEMNLHEESSLPSPWGVYLGCSVAPRGTMASCAACPLYPAIAHTGEKMKA